MLCLDTVHLAMVYEYSTWHKKTPGSRFLRRIMAKFCVRGEGLTADTWGEPFDGTGCRPLSVEEDSSGKRGKGRRIT
jgi:hypothetical protein